MQAAIVNTSKNSQVECPVETILSFEPFIRELRNRVKSEDTIKTKFYKFVLAEFEKEAALAVGLASGENVKFKELMELIYTTVSPLIVDEKSYLWALGTPVPNEIFYGTDAFYSLYKSHNQQATKEPSEITDDYPQQLELIYKQILEHVYKFPAFFNNEITYSYTDPETKLLKYYRVHADFRFVDIKVKGKLPELDLKTIEPYFYEGGGIDLLENVLPLNLFTFEGFTIITLVDVTPDQAIETIRSAINSNIQNENELYTRVIQALKTLIEDNEVEFGLLPFIKVNNRFVFDTRACSKSILIRSALVGSVAEESFNSLVNSYIENPKTVFFSEITSEKEEEYFFLKVLKETGIQSYGILPVFFNKKLAGIMEVYSTCELVFYEKLLSRLDAAIPFLAQLLQQSINEFNARMEAVIKEKFTSLQSAVQWKFNDVAFHHLKEGSGNQVIETVSFKDVYPLYGAIDIRNSTIERNKALQEDIRTNLTVLIDTLTGLKNHIHLDLTDELIFKAEKWLNKIKDPVLTSDEIRLDYFFKREVSPFLLHFRANNPDAVAIIDDYLKAADENNGAVFANRRNLESSMQLINVTINNYFEKAQEELQGQYPFYFEKFRTDGIEYDIYMGQSITPSRSFNPIYLKNLRLWQLKSMIEISWLTKSLLSQMPRPLETTQLIFIHGSTIDISFRNDERKFDVEGAYNIRYEVIKKRIDKVVIKNTRERLTQPGKIALVYFDQSEADEYTSYVEYLQEQDFLNNDLEYLDLEELQGVTGLKALRVGISPGHPIK